MVAANHHRSFDLPLPDQIIDGQAKLGTLAIAQPADARRESLKFNALAGEVNPAVKDAVLGEKFQHQIIGYGNVSGIAGKRCPAEGAASFTEEWTNIGWHEAGKIIGILDAPLECKSTDVVAVVKSNAAHLLQAQHAFDVAGDGVERALLITMRVALAQLQRF